ncbi:MAG: DUF2177 family protein [Candidatus Woesearchaeota archaeon]
MTRNLMIFFKKYFIALFIVLVFDFLWLLVIMNEFYNNQLSAFASHEVFPLWSGLLAWSLIPLGIVLFVDKISDSYKKQFIYGAVYGFILYGLYEFTNYAILGDWPLLVVFVDVLWGIFLCSTTAVLFQYVYNGFFVKSAKNL